MKNKFPLFEFGAPSTVLVSRLGRMEQNKNKSCMLHVLCDDVTITLGFFENDPIANRTKADAKRPIQASYLF